MLTGETRNTIDKLWESFWTGGITNPLSVIEQITYLLFLRKLDEIEILAERQAQRTGKDSNRLVFGEENKEARWSYFKQLSSDKMLETIRDKAFPFIKSLGVSEKEAGIPSTFSEYLKDANFLVQKPSLISSAVEVVSQLDLDNPDTTGDLYEYLLSKLSTSGINGQFRTPRHIIRMMVELVDPSIGQKICDPACGTAGFLFASAQYLLEKYTSQAGVITEKDGSKRYTGDKLDWKTFKENSFFGLDSDSSMLRIASMNLWLHGIDNPNIFYADSLSKNYEEKDRYDIVLANPPFKGSLDESDVNPDLLSKVKTKKTELLFLALILRSLDIGGKAAVIVPDGVLFGSSNAHQAARKLIVENNQLEGIISMPSGVFKPYAGVSTAILIFTKGGETENVWFYDMEHDGYSLDDKRQPIEDNDIPDILSCWKNRKDKSFSSGREKEIVSLRDKLQPLKQKRLELNQKINQLTFESVLTNGNAQQVNSELESRKQELDNLNNEIHELQRVFNQYSRQFWVTKEQIKANKYDLSASRYRQIEQDEQYYEKPDVTISRMKKLENVIEKELDELNTMVSFSL